MVAAAPIEESTSYLAAAVWFPTHVGPADRVAGWGRHTYDVLAEQAARGIPGVVMRESLALYREPPGEPDWVDAVRGVRAATAAELPPGYRYGLRFVVPLVEMPLYLPWLAEQVRANGAEVYTRRVHSLRELAEDGVDAIVNCSGLAARELVGDQTRLSRARADRAGQQSWFDHVHPRRATSGRTGLRPSARTRLHPRGHARREFLGHPCRPSGVSRHWLTAWSATRPRATLARMSSAVAVHTNGLGSLLCAAR